MTVSETPSHQAPTLNQSKELKEDTALKSHGQDANMEEPKLKVETGDEWQRLSLISILYFTIRNFTNSAQVLIYTIPALAISFNIWDNLLSPEVLIGAGILFLSTSVSGVISFLMYKFRVHNQHVEIHHGVFQRRYTNLPLWRIQNVKIERPFYYRPFGYALVVLDTAGSGKEEAKIVAVPEDYAEALKKQVLYEKALHDEGDLDCLPNEDLSDEQSSSFSTPRTRAKAVDSSHSNEEVLNRRSVKDIIIHGITNNRVWIILGAAAPFYDDVFGLVSEWLADKGLQLNQLVGEQTVAWWQFGLYAFVILMMLMALVALLSVGGALFTFYGYTLSRTGDRYIRRSGLLNKLEVSMRASRIQMITAKQDWLDKILKRVNLYFEQNSTAGQQMQELISPNKLIVPSVTEDEAFALSQEVMPGCDLRGQDYQTISKRFITFWLLAGWTLPLAIFFTIGAASSHLDIMLGALVVYGAVALLLTLRWWRWGIAYDNKYVYIRRGRVGVDYQCFEPYKAQQVIVKQSVFMKRRKQATVKFVLASGAVTVPFLPEDYVNKLADSVLFEVESTRRSWM
ncbi:MAG: PH domain-containing protein [Alteromonas macleodii]|uniref:PH domain-containing protein n=1 Tax=Alteromonas TaxID=226 RepID=UPI00127E25B3|nr:PH domain-containing protein [Alteromonas macleodii]MDM7961285.1 PH domain-containing protein [Alteromonas macleodii]MDM8169738.1 PH domain-containing protein [Alteromonas macleodii]CAI3965683.1 putative membrane protein [Alteromonas macleodii]VTP57095.1 putative membrane protein [Alteromonas macleodii]